MVTERQEAIKEQKLSMCQYHRAILADDETADWCYLSDHPCMVAYGDYDCEEWKQVQAEWLKERHGEKPEPYPSFRIVR